MSIWTQFLSNRPEHVMVDGYFRKLVSVVSGVPQGSVLGPLFIILHSSELFSILENKLIYQLYRWLHIDCCNAVAEKLNCDLGRVSEWCDLLRYKIECE